MLTEAEAREQVRDLALSTSSEGAYSVYEFWLPRFNTRADVAIVGDSLHGYEVKTAKDTLDRLPRQVEAYSHVFDLCSGVVAERHVEGTLKLLPHWWGVIIIDNDSTINCIRQPRPNPMVDPRILVRLLWRDEAYEALDRLGACPDPHMNRSSLWKHLVSILHLDALRQVVLHALLTRDPSRATIPTKRFT